jgi:hypothetical protein
LDKKKLSETDICEKFISPALAAAGWDIHEQILREYPLRPGRMVVRGHLGQKSPHAGPEVSHDPDELMAEYRGLQAEAQGIRDQLEALLGGAMLGRA